MDRRQAPRQGWAYRRPRHDNVANKAELLYALISRCPPSRDPACSILGSSLALYRQAISVARISRRDHPVCLSCRRCVASYTRLDSLPWWSCSPGLFLPGRCCSVGAGQTWTQSMKLEDGDESDEDRSIPTRDAYLHLAVLSNAFQISQRARAIHDISAVNRVQSRSFLALPCPGIGTVEYRGHGG